MTITFVDASGQRVIRTRELRGQLLAPNGTTILLDESRVPGLWLVNGTYLVSDVTTLGLDVSIYDQSFTTTPNGAAIIRLALYDIAFKVHDTITSLPVSGAVVTLTLPDGSTESTLTGSDGTAVFQQLPISSYMYEMNGNWLLQSRGNATIGSDGSMKLDIGIIYIPSLVAAVLSAVAIVIVSASLIRRKKHARDRELS
jgi:hypothetical protein